jgi:chorismate dehydratase
MMPQVGLRLGSVPYLNARPLTAWFEEPGDGGRASVVVAVPSKLARMLQHGLLDVALVSSVEAFRGAGEAVVVGVSIAARGAVKSVRVFANKPWCDVRTLATDEGSLTSDALARIVLREMHGTDPECRPMDPDVPKMLSVCDAALVIGDAGMRPYSCAAALDLGEAWGALTGLPFVYAAWIARDRETARRAGDMLRAARDWGVARRPELARDWSRRTRMPFETARDYLVDVMEYDLDEMKRSALERFRELCVAHGVMQDGPGAVYG